MLYVYGIADSAVFEVLPGEGQEGGDVFPVSAGNLAAVASRLRAGAVEATPQSVRCHERVLRRLMQDHAILPFRFGTICGDIATLTDRLLGAAEKLGNDLRRVRGKVEMALRIVEDDGREARQDRAPPPDEGATAGGRGTAYLRARRQYHLGEAMRENQARRIGRLLSEYAGVRPEDLVCSGTAEGMPLSVSCLIDRNRVGPLHDALEQFRADHPMVGLSCTGPWAPYSFVTPAILAGG